MHDADGDAERPGGGGDEPALAVARRRVLPIAGGELVLDQPILRRRVGYAEQRLGERHQRQPLLGGEAVIVHEVLKPADAAARLANGRDVATRAVGDAILVGPAVRGFLKKALHQRLVGGRIFGGKRTDRSAPFGTGPGARTIRARRHFLKSRPAAR